MSNKIWCLLLVLVVVRASLAIKCKKYVTQSRSVDEYYSMDEKNNTLTMKAPNGAVEIHFSIQASTGCIVLSPKYPIPLHPEDSDAVYEIVFGSEYNGKITLRRNRSPKSVNITNIEIVDIPFLLSAAKLSSFYFKISEDGVIEVGREGLPPLIRYLDLNPLDIKYFGFSSWEDIETIFLFDCPRPGSDSDHGCGNKEESALNPTTPSMDEIYKKYNDDQTGKPENEFTVKISGPDLRRLRYAHLDFGVGDKTGDLPQYRYLFDPLYGALNKLPYPYKGSLIADATTKPSDIEPIMSAADNN